MKKYLIDIRPMTPHFPGIGRYIHNLIHHLPDQLTANEQLILLANPDQVTPSGLKTVHVTSSPFSVRQQWEIPQKIRGIRPTIFHATYYMMPYYTGIPTVTTIYDMIPLIYPQYVSRKARMLYRFFSNRAIQASDQLIAISNATAVDTKRILRVDSKRITTIPLASDPRFKPPSSQEIGIMRAEFGLPERYFLYIGSNKPHKNLGRLAEAYSRLEVDDCPLVLAGPWDTEFDTIADSQKELIASGKIRQIGRVDDRWISALYGGAMAFTFVSEYEGFGLPPLEAMACGTPVLAGNQSCLPELVGTGGLLVDPTSADAIEEGLRACLSGNIPTSADALAQASLFSWERCAEQTLAVYRQMV